MDDAPHEPQSLADVVTVPPNVLLADLCVHGKEISHTSGFGKNVGSVAYFTASGSACCCYLFFQLLGSLTSESGQIIPT